jgi:hypothetical protein
MSYESCVLEGLFVVRWGPVPETTDVARYADELERARQAQGKPLVGLFIMPTDSAAPDDQFRKAQANKLPEIMKNFSYAVAVFEGVGFLSSLKRSALAAILLLAPKRQSIYVRSTVEEALLLSPAGPLPFNAVTALAELRRRNVVRNTTNEKQVAASSR